MIEHKKGNIFTSKCQTIVNTVNCVGVMGAGIAFEFKLRYPQMYEKYVKHCEKKALSPGKLWIYSATEEEKEIYKFQYILNFPTKNHWKLPSKIEYLEQGLEKFLETYKEKNITSIAFPLLGTFKGGLNPEKVFILMEKYLKDVDIFCEIWEFDKFAKDDLFEKFKTIFYELKSEGEIKSILNQEIDKINKLIPSDGNKFQKVSEKFIKNIIEALENKKINRISDLLNIQGIGERRLELCFRILNSQTLHKRPKQLELL